MGADHQSIMVDELSDSWKTVKVKSHSLHGLCSRICSFPPSLTSYFIKKYTNKNDVVFDAWSGKGTVPLDALRHGRIGIGNDRSPEAFVLTYAKTNPITLGSLEAYLKKIASKMEFIKLDNKLTELDRKARIFYSHKTFEQLRKLKEAIRDDVSDEGMFTKAIILGILHGNSKCALSLSCSHSYSMSPAYVKKYAKEHKLRRPSRKVLSCILEKGKLLLSDPLPSLKGKALNNDSRKISLESESVHMILSSPPYFNAQTYAWGNWLRLWFLGHDFREIRKTLAESGVEEKYRSFMRDSIKELYRVLVPGGKCFIVVGDVKKHSKEKIKIINTAEFILPLLDEQGFIIDSIIVDCIPSHKRVMTHIKEDEGIKTERIICLTK